MTSTHASIPSVIAFEGVDGAGKSTVIARVAAHLQAQGHRVHLPRTGKEHDSRPTRMIRRLTRDPRNLALCSMSEFLLYCAREIQILEEEVRPARERGDIVLLDRTLLTPEVMGIYGRGLDSAHVRSILQHARPDLAPDLTMVFEVHPRTSRVRKRIAKLREQGPRDPGRKGLSGSAFKDRVRAGYIEIANERNFPHFCVERMTPDELAEQVLRCIHGQEVERTGIGEDPRWQIDPKMALEDALEEIEAVDPALALYFSRGLICGRARRERWLDKEPELVAWSLDASDPLHGRALERCPALVLSQSNQQPWQGHDDLRRVWSQREPNAVLQGLSGIDHPQADALREELLGVDPAGVVESLSQREDDIAQRLRNRGWKHADVFARAESLCGCVRDKNQRRRAKLQRVWPHLAAASLRGVPPDIADPQLREAMAAAPKAVLRALIGREDPSAARMREALVSTGREVVDSLRGLEDPHSWAMREAQLERWPSTVAWSLWGVRASEQREAMLNRCAELASDDLHFRRRQQLFAEAASLPQWAWPRRTQALRGEAL